MIALPLALYRRHRLDCNAGHAEESRTMFVGVDGYS